jgi:peptidoglycan/LPS O-acetylase OafA/YrhL
MADDALSISARSARAPAQSADRLLYIDGLRAVAILCVIGFHAGVSSMAGGFVGVDVFFVISGFLITSQIAERALAGTFSAREFYARRILRIFPPLLLVTVITLVGARFFPLLARELRELGESAAATAAMVSNYYFMTAGSFDYFAVRSETQPLLHTWTLGVEEQYYLLAPWIIVGVLAYAARRRLPPLKLLLIASAALCVLSLAVTLVVNLAMQTPSAARFEFYSLLTRAWQFGAGGTLALAILHGWRPPAKLQAAAGAAGHAAIALAVAWYDERTPYPGAAALLPTLGAALVLAGGYLNGTSWPARVLSSPPAVTIGLLSYGWYLWHWPLLAFTRSIDPEQGVWKSLAVSAAALALSGVTYVAVEQPMKRLRQGAFAGRHSTRIIVAGVGVSALIAILALVSARAVGPDPGIAIRDITSNYCRVEPGIPQFPGGATCKAGDSSEPTTLILGDSHAMLLSVAADALGRSGGGSALMAALYNCPALLNIEIADANLSARCRERTEAVLRWLQSEQGSKIRGIVLMSRWAFYSGKRSPSRSERRFPRLRLQDRSRGGDFNSVLSGGLADLLAALERPDRRILVIGPVPELRQSAPDCLLRTTISKAPRERCAIGRGDVDARYGEIVRTLHSVTAKFPNVRLIDPIPVLCDAEYCRPYDRDGVLYTDTNHLGAHGIEKLLGRYQNEFRWVTGNARR